MLVAVFAHFRIDAVRGCAHREFAQGDQVALAEEILQRMLRPLRQIDLAFLQPLQQLVGRDVDEFDLVGLVEHLVRHGLLHARAGDLGDDVVEAFDVLDVDRGIDVDACGEQLFHVLPALGMA